MRYVSLKKTKTLSVLALVALTSSCSLKSNDQQQTLTIALPGANFVQNPILKSMTEWISLAWASTTTATNLNTDPASLSEFDCFAVNVNGPGINLDPNITCSDPSDAPAIFGGFVPNGNSSIDLVVPSGPDRTIKVLGIKSLIGCPNLHDMVQDGAIDFKNIGHFYEVGGTRQDIFSDATVTIKASYSTASAKRAFDQCKRTGETGESHLWGVYGPTGIGKVNATKTVGSKVYIGGAFDYVGPNTHSGVVLSQPNGALPTSDYPHLGGIVKCALADDAGGFYVGGNFDHFENNDWTSVHRIAFHMYANGALDPNFVAIADTNDKMVNACAFDGTYFYLGGNFSWISSASNGPVTASGLAAINVSDQSIHTFATTLNGTTPTVNALALSGLGKLFVGGEFWYLSGAQKNAIAFDTSMFNEVTSWHPNPDGPVLALAYKSSSVYLGGSFNNIGASSQSRNFLAKVDDTLAIVDPWNPNVAGTPYSASGVTALTADALNVYVATYGSTSYILRAANSGTTPAISSIFSGPTYNFNTLALDKFNTQLLIGGEFDDSATHRRNLIAFTNLGATPSVDGFKANTNSGEIVYAIAPNANGQVYVGGTFSSIGGEIRNNLAAIDLSDGTATLWNPSFSMAIGDVTSLDSDGTRIYAGYLSNSANSNYPGIAGIDIASNTVNWNYQTAQPFPNQIDAVAVNSGAVYIGGSFTSLSNAGGQSLTGLQGAAKIATDGTIQSWKPQVGATSSQQVRQILFKDNSVYLAGNITPTISSTTYQGMVRVDATTASLTTGWNSPGLSSGVQAMTFDPSGNYILAATAPSGPQVKLISATSGAVSTGGFNPDVSSMSQISKILMSGNTFYIAGLSSGPTSSAILAFEWSTSPSAGATGTVTPLSGFLPGIENYQQVLTAELTSQGQLILGGNFQSTNVDTSEKKAAGIGSFNAATGELH